MEREVHRLIALLDKPSPPLLNNVVYYTPRISLAPLLIDLVDALFYSPLLRDTDPLEVYKAGEAIATWKMRISLPSLPLSQFFGVFDSCFKRCYSWSIGQVALLAGMVSARSEFMQLQKRYCIDGSGQVESLLCQWRQRLFLPLWVALLGDPGRDEVLVRLYAGLSDPSDVGNAMLAPWWNTIAKTSFRAMAGLVRGPGDEQRLLSGLARTLQFALGQCNEQLVGGVLGQMVTVAQEVGQKSTPPSSSAPFIALVVTTRGCLEARSRVPRHWYRDAILVLYYLNSIAREFGTLGFESYEYVYELSVAQWPDTNSTIHAMTSTELPQQLFLLGYIARAPSTSPQLHTSVSHYLTSNVKELREAAHSAMVALMTRSPSAPATLQWRQDYLLEYASLVILQYNNDALSSDQLNDIFRCLAPSLVQIHTVNSDAAMALMHTLYRAIINTDPHTTCRRRDLLKCLTYQLPYCYPKYIVSWLENVNVLAAQSNDPQLLNDVHRSLWDVVSHSKNDIALRWWYDQRTRGISSRL